MNIQVMDFVMALNRNGVTANNYTQVGSQYIGGAHKDSDDDWLVLVSLAKKADAQCLAGSLGYNQGGSGEVPDDRFESYTHYLGGKLNLILVFDEDYFHKWVLAARVCKYLNGVSGNMNKNTRVGVHRVVME